MLLESSGGKGMKGVWFGWAPPITPPPVIVVVPCGVVMIVVALAAGRCFSPMAAT